MTGTLSHARNRTQIVRNSSTKLTEGIETKPQVAEHRQKAGTVSVVVRDGNSPEATTEEAAKVLVEHLFAQGKVAIPGISYAVGYKLAEGPTGGDIVDVYHYDNDSIAFDRGHRGERSASSRQRGDHQVWFAGVLVGRIDSGTRDPGAGPSLS